MTDMSTVTLDPEREAALRSLGQVSYLLHGIVAVGAVIPSFQPGVALLVVAFLLDLFKRDDAREIGRAHV